MELLQKKKKTAEYSQRSLFSNFQGNNTIPAAIQLFIDEQCPVRNMRFSM